jgi:MFS family permease
MPVLENGAEVLRRRDIAAVTLGNALEFYDFLTYSFFAIQIGHAFFPGGSAYVSLMGSLATFGAGFATRPLGAIVIGRYADRVGRKPAMLLSFVLIGASIFAMALIPSYAAIGVAAPILAVLARMAQGFSLGGEIGSNTAFLLEASSPERRGFIVSWQGASQMIALFAGSVIGVALTALLPPHLLDVYGWRIAFLLGGVAVPFGLWLRTSLPETLHRVESGAQAAPASVDRVGLAQRHWRVMALGIAILGMGTIGSYIQIYVVTYAQNTLHLSQHAGFLAETGNTVVAIPAMLLGGWLSDRYGRRTVNVLNNAVFLVLIYPLFAWVVAVPSAAVLCICMAILGVFSNLGFGSFCAALSESLPKAIRCGGFGTVYSLAIALFGGTTQFVVTWLIHRTGSAMAPAWYLLAATSIAQIALMLFPESAPGQRRNRSAAPLPQAA